MAFLDNLVAGLILQAKTKSIYRTSIIGLSTVQSFMNTTQSLTVKKAKKKEYNYYKVWVTEKDELVRDTHKVMEGKEVLENEKFLVGGELMENPGDDSVSLALWINCRCFLRYRRELK